MSKPSPVASVVRGVVPTFGHDATVTPALSAPDELAAWRHTGIMTPLAWAFVRREGSPDVRYLTPEDAAIMNAQLNRGSELLHATPKAGLDSINYGYEAMKRKLASSEPWLQAGEMDIVDKYATQRRHGPMWYLPSAPPPLIAPTAVYKQVASALAKFYYSRYMASPLAGLTPYELALTDSDPPDTNAGWPLYSSSIGDFLVLASNVDFHGRHSGATWPSPSEWVAAIDELGNKVGVTGDMFTMGVARRAGPMRKAVALYDLSSGHPAVESFTFGCYTRSRIVYMAPRLLNIAVSPFSMQMKAARLSHWGFAHDGESRKIQMAVFKDAAARGLNVIESDFSGYDASFTPEHRSVIFDVLKEVGFHPDSIDLIRMIDERGSFVTPSWSGIQGGEGERVSGRFGLFSGIKDTSNLGSFHAQCVVLKAFIQAGELTLDDIVAGRLPPFLNLSDDVLIAAPPSITPAAYERVCAEEGLKAKLIVGRRMLMRHIAPEGEYSVAARVVQQTIANEDAYLHLGHVLLGLASRLSVPMHPSLFPTVKDILFSTLTGPAALPIRESGLDSRVLLKHPSVGEFIASARGKSWLEDLILTSETRPAVAELIRAATDAGAIVSLQAATVTRKTIIDTLLRDPLPSAVDALGVLGERLTFMD